MTATATLSRHGAGQVDDCTNGRLLTRAKARVAAVLVGAGLLGLAVLAPAIVDAEGEETTPTPAKILSNESPFNASPWPHLISAPEAPVEALADQAAAPAPAPVAQPFKLCPQWTPPLYSQNSRRRGCCSVSLSG